MKQKLLAVLAVLALAPAALSQPDDVWENWGIIQAPPDIAPQIDAITFINHKGASFQVSGTVLFDTSDTLNYTNQGVMTGFPGFDFRTYPSTMGQPTMAANFANLASGPSGGVINCNGTFIFGGVPGLFFGNLTGNSKLLVWATNIVNSGSINMSAAGLIQLKGRNIDLTRGALNVVNPTSDTIFGTNAIFNGINILFNSGILDGYWAAETATNAMIPSLLAGNFPTTPMDYWVTNRDYMIMFPMLFGSSAYVNDSGVIGSNRTVQAVFLSNFSRDFVNTVYFTPAEIAVQWQWTTVNWPANTLRTNYMYLTDNFGEVTNIGVQVDGYINPQALYPTPTYKPINYRFVQGIPYNTNIPPATAGLLPNVFDNTPVTNEYAAFEAIFASSTQLPGDITGGAPSNMVGRIEISADSKLNLSKARISTLNYLRLQATNHFAGSQNAMITTPYADYDLRATNGTLYITNIIAPFVNHPSGTCDLWSGRWTNVVNSITNSFHVLFVESFLEPTTLPQIPNLKLVVTNTASPLAPRNLVINDILNVTTSMELNSERITIAANDADAFSPAGQLNLLRPEIVWPTSTPNLQYLTNRGSIAMNNAVYFGGSRTQPPYSTNVVDIPYQAFVNHGAISNNGSLIWANYFENGGTLNAGQGSILLQKCSQALLSGGYFGAYNGQVGITAGTLSASNFSIQCGGALELWVTNAIRDGGGQFSFNNWTAGDGFSMYLKPATGDLLSTTVYNSAPDYAETLNYWAGQDLGRKNEGFTNNCAVGRLILSGGTDSSFRFIGTGSRNAMYVDSLDLSGSATNRDAYGDFTGLNIDPNMTIYFAQATANGVSVAEKLNGRNGGHLIWVTTYAGNYSSTNILYPDGKVYTFNRALVSSCNLDSDGDGIVNCLDPTPCLVPGQVQLTVGITNRPSKAAVITWQTAGNSTNYLDYKTSPTSTNWLALTNFVFGPLSGKASVLDTNMTSTRYYRVRIDARQP
jgi:hypothetical protein